MKVKSESEVAQSCLTLRDPMDYQAPLPMGFSSQEYWSGSPVPNKELDIEPFNFSFFSVTGWGIDLDYCDIEWFVLERNRAYQKLDQSTRGNKEQP